MARLLNALLLVLLAVTLTAAPATAQKRPSDFSWIGPHDGPPPVLPELRVSAADLPAGTVVLTAPLGGAAAIDASCLARGVFCVRSRLARLGLSGSERVAVGGHDPGEVGLLFWLLEWSGFEGVRVLDAPAPDSTPPPASEAPAGDLSVPVGDGAVDRSWLRDRFGTPEVEVVDLRPEATWEAGQVPHSLPFDFASLLTDDASWPDAEAARRAFGHLGPRPNTYVDLGATFVVYSEGAGGGDGDDARRLGLAYLLLRMMGIDAAVYPGGWADWRSDPASPVVRVVGAAELRDLLAAGNPELEDRPTPGVTLLDVRGELDHRARHLPGSIEFPSRNCPETDWSVVPEPPAGDRFDAPLAFYCYGRTCIRSRNCSTAAARAGFRDVLWFRDGVPGWFAAGYPSYRTGEPGDTATRLP